MGVHQVGIGPGLFCLSGALAVAAVTSAFAAVCHSSSLILSTVYGNVINNNLNLVPFRLPEEKGGQV